MVTRYNDEKCSGIGKFSTKAANWDNKLYAEWIGNSFVADDITHTKKKWDTLSE